MFNFHKIRELTDQNDALKKENEALKSSIQELKRALDAKEDEIKSLETTSTNNVQDQILATLLDSYGDGMHFLQGTMEENLKMLSNINEVNNKRLNGLKNFKNKAVLSSIRSAISNK